MDGAELTRGGLTSVTGWIMASSHQRCDPWVHLSSNTGLEIAFKTQPRR